MEEQDMFSGLVRCIGRREVMTLHQAHTMAAVKNNFIAGVCSCSVKIRLNSYMSQSIFSAYQSYGVPYGSMVYVPDVLMVIAAVLVSL
jgi:hypothetical protein